MGKVASIRCALQLHSLFSSRRKAKQEEMAQREKINHRHLVILSTFFPLGCLTFQCNLTRMRGQVAAFHGGPSSDWAHLAQISQRQIGGHLRMSFRHVASFAKRREQFSADFENLLWIEGHRSLKHLNSKNVFWRPLKAPEFFPVPERYTLISTLRPPKHGGPAYQPVEFSIRRAIMQFGRMWYCYAELYVKKKKSVLWQGQSSESDNNNVTHTTASNSVHAVLHISTKYAWK